MKKTSLVPHVLICAAFAAITLPLTNADVFVANRFNNNVLKSDSTGLSGWTAFASFGSNARNVATDGSNVFIGTTDNAVYSFNSAGTQTGTNTPATGGNGRLTFAAGTTAFNGLIQAGSDNNIRRFGAAPVGAPLSTTAVGFSAGAAPSVKTIGGADHLFNVGGGNSVRRFTVTGGTPVNSATFTLQGQGTNFGQAHFFSAPNGRQFFGGHIAGGTLGGVYLDNTTNFGTVATNVSGALTFQKLTFANAAADTLNPGTTSILDMAFDPYSSTGLSANFYVLNAARLYKYDYTYSNDSFTLLGSTTGGIGTTLGTGLAINTANGSQLAFTPVPEPSTWLGGGLILGLAAWSQRKRFAA